ncbi:hypothetical protein QBZ16_003999 [Prototheca wickerhamii]|uniref:Uncharacterized protein n=1 Tax=Prototheca wickerhamii TaxID=3111 RepID=A0AAD9II49_PROWI|nr:hypothetical protein QBZ16_003999 [Prototheca wickerhamii]
MARYSAVAAIFLVALLSSATVFGQQCELTSAQVASGDYSKVGPACNNLPSSPSTAQCDTCICALTSAFAPVLQSAGVNITGATREEATSAISACINTIYGPLSRAGVDVVGLATLQSCTDEPACLTQAIAEAQASP